MNNNILKTGTWLYYNTDFEYVSINEIVINKLLNNFNEKVIKKTDKNILVQLRVKDLNKKIITIFINTTIINTITYYNKRLNINLKNLK